MKKILIALLAIIAIFTLTACGDKDDDRSSSKEKNKISQKEEKQEELPPVEEKKEEDEITDDDEIIDEDDEVNNYQYEEEMVNVEKVINCDGCVYGYFSKEPPEALKIGDTLSPEEYTTDVNTLKTAGGKQRHNFFGFVLADNKISKAYACILKDNKIYCIQGSTNGEYHQSNIAILNQIFTADQCKYISAGNTYTCTDGHYNGETITTGFTSLHYETSCTIYADGSRAGELICH